MCSTFINRIFEAINEQLENVVQCRYCNHEYPSISIGIHESVCKQNYNDIYIYVLKLEHNKYYVGMTRDPDTRLAAHFNNRGSGWTRKYKPIEVVELIPYCDELDEDKYVLKYMSKYGIENVRGGSFCQIILDAECVSVIGRMITHSQNRCFKCNRAGHFIRDCPVKAEENEDWYFLKLYQYMGQQLGGDKKDGTIPYIVSRTHHVLFSPDYLYEIAIQKR